MSIKAFDGSSYCYFHSQFSKKRFPSRKKSYLKLKCSTSNEEQDYLLDAPVSVGDGFSFSGGKYSDGPNPSDEWFKQGKMVKAYSIPRTGEKAKDPIFGLTMGTSSQSTGDRFRWFCVESGSVDNPTVILIHGFPSQAYSYRKVLPVLSKDYRAITFDWLEYVLSLESLIDELAVTKVSLVVQDPLRASDKALTSCGPYKMKEEDAMVYRRPYLISGSSGFALNAITRTLKKDLKRYVEDMQTILKDKSCNVRTTICWGQRDRWLSYDGVEDFCKDSNHTLIQVPKAGHHVQEDCGEELGQLIYGIIRKKN
ncbi:uncharacterized protein [Cicer arietinum]|uniref:uncharacterized protein isoform X7 n=1 Tax=Cicer arietinum TaxID=3827 RepID=UPI003CC62A19